MTSNLFHRDREGNTYGNDEAKTIIGDASCLQTSQRVDERNQYSRGKYIADWQHVVLATTNFNKLGSLEDETTSD